MANEKICCVCKEKFYIKPSREKRTKYCSKACMNKNVHTWANKDNKFWEFSKNFKWKTATDEEKKQRIKDKFEKYVIRQEGCWDWNGCLSSSGYAPMNYYNNKNKSAHIVSWILHRGKIPQGLCVLHKCDNRKCTNPEHLFLGTIKDNMQDMIKKGRANRLKGKECSYSKLTEDKVKKVRLLLSEGIRVMDISEKFKINYSTVSDIKHYRSWKHLK